MPAKIHTFFLGVYYGFLLILFIYNAAFFFGIHDRTNIFFAGYVISIGLFQVCADGFATHCRNFSSAAFSLKVLSHGSSWVMQLAAWQRCLPVNTFF
ncbi:MAG: 7TM diverse intracellular signaling domain-containing protein [Acidobacteriota bacterium]